MTFLRAKLGRDAQLMFDYLQKELRGLSPLANYTDRATAACR
jgi:hypothetical protein